MGREIDEDLIEATIRRVAESKAAREAPPIEMPVAESIAPAIEPDAEQAIEQAEQEPAPAEVAFDEEDDDFEVTPTPLLAASRGRGFARPAAAAAPAREPERDWDASGSDDTGIAVQLADIKRQLDAITTMLQQLTAGGARQPSIGPAWEQAAAATAVQRPAIFRDNGVRPASPEPEPEIIDTRPIPEPLPPLHVDEPKRGFDLLPRSYRITVEDKRRGVDLVPLHRALLSMDGVRDMSLLSYNNGVAIVALETTTELDPDALGAQVARAMSRDARVEVHNEHTMVVKLAEE